MRSYDVLIKSFKELTPAGQTKRLNAYAKEREARGTIERLVRMVKPATFKDNADGSKSAIFRMAHYNKETGKTEFFTASAYVAKGKVELEAFYAGLKKGQLVSVETKDNNGYTNVYNLMDRSYADVKAAAKETVQEDVDMPLE